VDFVWRYQAGGPAVRPCPFTRNLNRIYDVIESAQLFGTTKRPPSYTLGLGKERVCKCAPVPGQSPFQPLF